MAKTREYVKLWFSYDAYFESYTDEEVGRIVRAMIAYRKNGEQPNFEGNERFIWPVVKRDIDESRLAQERAAETSRENGKKGGRPRKTPAALPKAPEEVKTEEPEQEKQNETKENLNIQTGFFESKEKQTKQKAEPKTNQGFEAFWKAYPKKVGKAIARRSFERIKVPAETLIAAVNAQKQSQQWTKDNGQYIPNPATWLNQGRWEDELEPPKAAEKKPYTYEYRGIEDSL